MCYDVVGTLSDTKSHPETHYQYYAKKIPESMQMKLQYEIKSDHHIRRLAEKMIEWEEKYDLFHLDAYEFHDIKHGAYRDRPVLQR